MILKKFIKITRPPDNWKPFVIILSGILSGLFIFTAHVSRAPSYLSDKPETCINCHIMVPQYKTWEHSSHREWANCNDCHVPHNNIANKYYFKAKDGMRHATIFTLHKEPQVIFIHEPGQKVVHNNCIRCHENTLTDYKVDSYNPSLIEHRTERKCWDCHREVPHGRVNSLSSVPNAQAPLPGSPIPKWLKKYFDNIEH